MANSTRVAADLLTAFVGASELQIKDALLNGNLQAARRMNGLDRFAEAYRASATACCQPERYLANSDSRLANALISPEGGSILSIDCNNVEGP